MTPPTSVRVAAPVRPAPRPGAPPRRPRAQRVAPYLFIAPFLVVFVAFLFVPLVYALRLSLYADRLVGGEVFVGLDNFTRAARDPAFWSGVRRMALFGLFQIPIMLGLALAFALLLEAGVVYLGRLFRLVVFLPYAVPSVVAALMWGSSTAVRSARSLSWPASSTCRHRGSSPRTGCSP